MGPAGLKTTGMGRGGAASEVGAGAVVQFQVKGRAHRGFEALFSEEWQLETSFFCFFFFEIDHLQECVGPRIPAGIARLLSVHNGTAGLASS